MDSRFNTLIKKAKKYGLKESEAQVFITLLLNEHSLTQKEIRHITGLSVGAISDALNSLLSRGMVVVKKKDGANHYDANASFIFLFSRLIEKIMHEDIAYSLTLLSQYDSSKIKKIVKEFEEVKKRKDIIKQVVNASPEVLTCIKKCLRGVNNEKK